MAKTRVNWTIKNNIIQLLKQISKQQKQSISSLIEHAVLQTYQDRFEIAKEKVQYHGEQFEIWKKEILRIKTKRNNDRKLQKKKQ